MTKCPSHDDDELCRDCWPTGMVEPPSVGRRLRDIADQTLHYARDESTVAERYTRMSKVDKHLADLEMIAYVCDRPDYEPVRRLAQTLIRRARPNDISRPTALGRWLEKLVNSTEYDTFENCEGVDGYLEPKLDGDTLSVTYIPFEGVSDAPGVVERYRLVRLADEPPPYRCPPQTPYVPGTAVHEAIERFADES